MKLTRKLLTLLTALALCLGLLTGCGGEEHTAAPAQDPQDETQSEVQDQTAGDSETGDDETEDSAPADGEETPTEEETAGYSVYSVGDLELTEVNDSISTMAYLSCNGKEITVPVLRDANWDNTQIAEDKTFVETTNTTGQEMVSPEGSYYCTYYSEEQDYYDIDDMAQQYADTFVDEDGTSNAIVYPKTTSEDGAVQAVAVHGTYQGWEIYQYLITVDLEDEYAVLDLSFYTDDPSIVQPILDYWSLADPVTAD